MTERFTGIKALADWLLWGRRTSNVSLATELQPPTVEPGLLNEATTPISVSPNGRERRRLRKLLYDSERKKGENDVSPEKKRKRAKNGQSQERPTPVLVGNLDNIRPENLNLSRKDRKKKKHKLSVRELTRYAEENGFSVVGENDGHITFAHEDGRRIGFNKRPETLSPGLYADTIKTIESPKIK